MEPNKNECYECGGEITQKDRDEGAEDFFHYACLRAYAAYVEWVADGEPYASE